MGRRWPTSSAGSHLSSEATLTVLSQSIFHDEHDAGDDAGDDSGGDDDHESDADRSQLKGHIPGFLGSTRWGRTAGDSQGGRNLQCCPQV